MPVGTQENPVMSPEPMKVARALMSDRFSTENKAVGLYEYQGDYYEWYGGRWNLRDQRWLEHACWRWLEDCYCSTPGDADVTRRFAPNIMKVQGVMRALEATIHLPQANLPIWVGHKKKDKPPPGRMIAFYNVLINAATGEEMPRDESWFDVLTLPYDYEPDAPCERWMRCLQEWSDDDEVWATLLQRWFGYCIMPHREYAKWMLFHGKVRSGKGTITLVLQHLIGTTAFIGTSLDDIAGDYGLDGLEHARVLSFSEVSQMDNRDGERATRVLKNILGRDPLTINIKYKRQLRNVVVAAAPMISANVIPKLPNQARGLSSKMLVLPFDKGFEGEKEQYDLLTVLKSEIQGIASWAVKGALDLEAAPTGPKKFPMPERSGDAIRMYHLMNNPFDFFLEARFMKRSVGHVNTSDLKREWKDWLKVNDVKMHVAENQLALRVCHESSWDIERDRQGGSGAHIIRGMSLKKEIDDEA